MTPRLRAESTTVTTADSSGTSLTVILAGAQPHHLSLGWVESQSAGLHPVVDVGDARTQTGDDGSGVVGWSGDINLAVICVHVQPELVLSNNMEQFGSVHYIQQRP